MSYLHDMKHNNGKAMPKQYSQIEQEVTAIHYDRIELEIQFVLFFEKTRAAWEKLLTITEQDVANMFKKHGDWTIELSQINENDVLPLYCRMVLKFREPQQTPITGFYTRCDPSSKNILLRWAGIKTADLQRAKIVLDFCVWFSMFKSKALEDEPVEIKAEFDVLCKSIHCGLKTWCVMSDFLRPIVVKKYLANICRDGDECFISQIKFDFGMNVDKVALQTILQDKALGLLFFDESDD